MVIKVDLAAEVPNWLPGSAKDEGSQEATIREMMCDPLIRYVMVRDAQAGCFDLRVEKDNSRSLRDDK